MHILRFSRSRNPFVYNYSLSGTELVTLRSTLDLGVIVDSSLTFVEHIHHVSARANKILGFIRRSCSNFTNYETLYYLYSALVLPHLEYGSVIWSPSIAKYRQELEKWASPCSV